jgi:integrase
MASWKPATKTQYLSYLKQWKDYTNRQDVNPISPSISNVLDFLTELFNKGLSYSAINTARSSLSTVVFIDDKPVGQHPFVVRFLKGTFNKRPAIPKTNVTWDPQTVLDYLKTLSPVKNLSFKKLTFKCVTLLWLLSGQRGQSITLIDVRNVDLDKNRVKIRFGDLLKTTRPGFQQREIKLKAYAPDRRLCIVTVLAEYINRRASVKPENCFQLFISYQKPFCAVSKSSIARWVKTVMNEAGLDTNIFTPHSLRSASTSAAARNNVPLNTILATAGWSNENTFRKYYNKPLLKHEQGLLK